MSPRFNYNGLIEVSQNDVVCYRSGQLIMQLDSYSKVTQGTTDRMQREENQFRRFLSKISSSILVSHMTCRSIFYLFVITSIITLLHKNSIRTCTNQKKDR